jgi:hypothetical protein
VRRRHFSRSNRLEFCHNTYLVLITGLAQDIIKGSIDLRKLAVPIYLSAEDDKTADEAIKVPKVLWLPVSNIPVDP